MLVYPDMNFDTDRRIAIKVLKGVRDRKQTIEIRLEQNLQQALFGGKRIIDPVGLCCALTTLTPRQELVLRYRFGVNCGPLTLEEIAHTMRVTRERVRQIEAKAILQMRHPKKRRMYEL